MLDFMNAKHWIEKLDLLPHPEGGHYKETYRCADTITTPSGQRNISTAIYFLLEEKQKSHFHRIQSDELWFFHSGEALEILVLDETGLHAILLGNNPDKGEALQAVIPAGKWFGSRVKNQTGYALVSCTVAPGFDFNDFELAKANELSRNFPEHEIVIREMCIENKL
jgi:predicted cupin superfamily sugar epimerase